jgi:thiol-disulfide isomerase/thioredoxin
MKWCFVALLGLWVSCKGSEPFAAAAKPSVEVVDPKATVRFVPAPPMVDVAPLLKERVASAAAAGRKVIAYTGATWCEPCRLFHQAVDRGELNGKMGAVDLVAFDADVDAERLVLAGYESRSIPSFTVPLADGKASTKHTEGASKDGPVNDLLPRLKGLLAD